MTSWNRDLPFGYLSTYILAPVFFVRYWRWSQELENTPHIFYRAFLRLDLAPAIFRRIIPIKSARDGPVLFESGSVWHYDCGTCLKSVVPDRTPVDEVIPEPFVDPAQGDRFAQSEVGECVNWSGDRVSFNYNWNTAVEVCSTSCPASVVGQISRQETERLLCIHDSYFQLLLLPITLGSVFVRANVRNTAVYFSESASGGYLPTLTGRYGWVVGR